MPDQVVVSFFAGGIHRRHWLLLAAFLLAIFLFRMGGRGLNEPDEGRYANIAAEVLEPEHSWLDPQMTDVGHYDKPPLIYWATALSLWVFGFSEWAARVPSLLGALLTLTGLGWTAYRLYGRQVAWWAVLMGGTMLHIWFLGRVLTPDMLLTGWCTLAIAAWAETRRRQGAWGGWCLQVLFWTLAWWTKATPMLVPLLGLALYAYGTGGLSSRQALKLPLLLPVVLLLGAPWFLYITYRHPELENFFLHREIEGRVTGHVDGRHGPVWYYLVICLAAWLPWWPLAAFSLVRQKKILREQAKNWKVWLGPEAVIIVVGLLVFSAISSKLPTYTLTLAPWAALLMARLLIQSPGFFKPAPLLVIACCAVFFYETVAVTIPRYETSLGRNSSLKSVTAFLKNRGAVGVHADFYWPGLEFYWGEDMRFTQVKPPLEISDGSDNAPEHFETTPSPQGNKAQWFIHYRKRTSSPFQAWLENSGVEKIQMGDFIVGPLQPL